MIRNVRAFACILPLLWAVSAPAFDLKGGNVVARGQCAYRDSLYSCFGVEKDKKLYLVAVDSEGPLAVYSVKEIKADYADGELLLVWERMRKGERRASTT